jgi:DNA-binding transcriptional regulator YiaG
MPNIAAALKQEMSRIARKEIKAQTEPLRKANAQYRRDVAQLKRQATDLSRQLAYLEQQERRRASATPSQVDIEGKRFSRRGLKTHREKLGVSAAEYAKLVGVTAQSVYNWEQGRAKPAAEQLASLLAIRGLGKREALKRLELLEG